MHHTYHNKKNAVAAQTRKCGLKACLESIECITILTKSKFGSGGFTSLTSFSLDDGQFLPIMMEMCQMVMDLKHNNGLHREMCL